MSQEPQGHHETDMNLQQDGEQLGACKSSRDPNPIADEVLSQVSELENQFASMKELLRKQAILQLEVRRQQAEIVLRDDEASKKQTVLVALQEQNYQATQELNRQRMLLAEQEASLATTRSELEAEREKIEAAQHALEASGIELEHSRKDVETRAAELSIQSSQLLDESVQRETKSRAQEAELMQRLEYVQAALVQAQTAEDQLASQRAELFDIRQDLAAQAREIIEHRDGLKRDQEALHQTQRELETREGDLLAMAKSVENSKQLLDQRTAEIEQASAAALQLAAQQAEDQAKILAQQQVVLRNQLEAQLEAQRLAQQQAHEQELLQVQQEAKQQAEEVSQKLAQQLSEHMAQELAQQQEQLQAQQQAQVQALQQALHQAQQDVEAIKLTSLQISPDVIEVFTEYEALWAFERSAMVKAHEDLYQAKTDLDHCDGIITGLKERMKQDLDQRRRLEQSNEELKVQAASSHDALMSAEESLTKQEYANKLLREAQLTAASDETWQGKFTQSNTIRQKRLRLYKSLLRQQAMKVRKASEALRKRYEQAEQVLAQRAELAAARLKIIEAQRILERKSASSRAAVFVLCILCIGTLVSALSWAIAREVAPAKFEAISMVKAESKERTLNDGELAEWQRMHESIIEDGRLHEALAERFKRQGILSLAEASAVGAMTRQNLYSESRAPGELKLRLVSQGAEQTSRVLEIFTNGLANFVNSGGIRRVDGATTMISQTATVGTSPVDNIRAQYTLGLSGLGIVVCSLIGFFIWSRLARAKTAFEQDIRLAETLNE